MFLYYGKHYEASIAGGTVVGIRCDRCNCEYFYQLVRIGSGSTDAPYGIGKNSAENKAANQSQTNLLARIQHEAELVPCPACHWINDELVAGYRRTRYRSWKKFVIFGSIFVISIALICAWFVSLDPQWNHSPPWLFLAVIPACCIGISFGLLGLRAWLRTLIRPNRNFPLPPVLPLGTPPALILDPQQGQLVRAETKSISNGDAIPTSVVFQIGRDRIPFCCCECLGVPAPEETIKQPTIGVLTLDIPLCRKCGRKLRRRAWKIGLSVCGGVFLVEVGLLFALRLDSDAFWILFFAGLVVAPILGAVVAKLMTRPVRCKVRDAARGIVQLRFRNREFTRQFQPQLQSESAN